MTPEKALKVKKKAANLANYATGGYASLLGSVPEEFNKAASPEKREALKNIQIKHNDHIGASLLAYQDSLRADKPGRAESDKEFSIALDAIIEGSEMIAEVLTTASPEAEKYLVRLFKSAADRIGYDLAASAKVYVDADAPILANIAQKAMRTPKS